MRPMILLACLLAAPCSAQALEIHSTPREGIAQKTLKSEVVLIGKVTGFEKETFEAKADLLAPGKTAHTVAVVEVESVIRGLKNTTHIRVGFVMMAEKVQTEEKTVEDQFLVGVGNLAENGRYLLFLQKHPDGAFYTYRNLADPVAITEADGQTAAIDEARIAGQALADPVKALKADKAEDRALAALVLIVHYRQASGKGVTERIPIDALENKLLLDVIAEGDWTAPVTGDLTLFNAFHGLGLGKKEGWEVRLAKPGANERAIHQKAFQDWLAGPGAKFRFRKYVLQAKR